MSAGSEATHASGGWPEVDFAPGTLAIADLHLDAGPHARPARDFEAFLERARSAPRLVILGDLFDAWVGPAHAELAGARRVLDALASLVRAGTALDIVHGNRDFLLEESFERRTGARVHPAGLVGRCAGVRTLLVHGDELCTLDHGYQRLKRALRSAPIRWLAPRLPRPLSLAAARRLRSASVRAVAEKPPESKRQQRDAASELALAARARQLVVGHAHEFRDEDDGGLRWIVLDAFGGARDCLRWGPDGALEPVSSASASRIPGPSVHSPPPCNP
jgi:UDP-2,3-diacylglucosamine hydrolase